MQQITERDIDNVIASLKSGHTGSRGPFTERVETKLKKMLNVSHLLMTTSCTHALEMALKLTNLSKGDEVLMPTYSFPSVGNAILLAGLKPVIVPVEQKTLSLSLDIIKRYITTKTKAIVLVHYAGVCEDIKSIATYCQKHDLFLIEDAAQALGAQYKNKYLGTYGDFGCFSFHQTKNQTCGEGGALVVHQRRVATFKRAEIMLEKGTNRMGFMRGDYAYYQWQALGSSYAPSDVLMALLSDQIDRVEQAIHVRMSVIDAYRDFLKVIKQNQCTWFTGFKRQDTVENGHLFYLRFYDVSEASHFFSVMNSHGVLVKRHFVPLHQSIMGKDYCVENKAFKALNNIFDRLIRLPIDINTSKHNLKSTLSTLEDYFRGRL